METIDERIDSLDDKDALNVVSQLTTAIMRKVPDVKTAYDLVQYLETVARDAGLSLQGLAVEWVDATVENREAGAVARALLHALATPGRGAEFVTAAIEEFPSDDQDLGVLPLPIAAGFFYIAVVSDLDIDLGWFKLKKEGLPAARQVELAKTLLPRIFGDWFKVGSGAPTEN